MNIFTDAKQLDDICQKYHINRLSLFDAEQMITPHDTSELDLLIEFENEQTPSLLTLVHLELAFSDLANRRKLHLRTPSEAQTYYPHFIPTQLDIQYQAIK